MGGTAAVVGISSLLQLEQANEAKNRAKKEKKERRAAADKIVEREDELTAASAKSIAARRKGRGRVQAGARDTILTSPIGVSSTGTSSQGVSQRKTLLGQ